MKTPKLIIINGKPAVGKSTLMKILRQDTQLSFLSKDDIKEFLFDTIGTADREWSQVMGRASIEMLYKYTEQLIMSGKDIGIENAFWADFAVKEFESLCKKTGAQTLELYCFTDGKTRLMRNNIRLQNGARHKGHVDEELVMDDLIDDVRYRPLSIGETIMIDTTKLDTEGYTAIVDQVQNFLDS